MLLMEGTVTGPAWVDVGLDTLRQEKEKSVYPDDHFVWSSEVWRAGFTCRKCPHPFRPHPSITEGEEGLESYTKRCKTCNAAMCRWTRNRRLEERIKIPLEHLSQDGCFVAFVTLTIPNVPESPARASLVDEVRSLKRRVASFRRIKRFEETIVGGIDVFENTIRPNGDWNIHHHGIWLMTKYWNQSDLQDDWGHRVRIEKVRRPHAVLKYLTSYATKEPIEGVRCLETFGVSRGAAFTAIAEYARRPKTSSIVELVAEEWQMPEALDWWVNLPRLEDWLETNAII